MAVRSSVHIIEDAKELPDSVILPIDTQVVEVQRSQRPRRAVDERVDIQLSRDSGTTAMAGTLTLKGRLHKNASFAAIYDSSGTAYTKAMADLDNNDGSLWKNLPACPQMKVTSPGVRSGGLTITFTIALME